MKEELGDKRGIAQTLHQIGMIHYQQGNYEEAVKKYNESPENEGRLGDKSGIAKTLHQIGMIQEENEEYDFSLKNYLVALSIFEKLNSPNSKVVRSSINRLIEKLGEEEFKNLFEKVVRELDARTC